MGTKSCDSASENKISLRHLLCVQRQICDESKWTTRACVEANVEEKEADTLASLQWVVVTQGLALIIGMVVYSAALRARNIARASESKSDAGQKAEKKKCGACDKCFQEQFVRVAAGITQVSVPRI